MKSHVGKLVLTLALFGLVTNSYAVPVLQVGAPGGPGEGTYADYNDPSPPPGEEDTAVTSGSPFTLYVAGVYGPNTLLLGGQFAGEGVYPEGESWADMGYGEFDNHLAVLVASVPEGSSGTLTVEGNTPFLSLSIFDFPNVHDPVKSDIADFLFFDIGNFANNPNMVPDFDTEDGAADGEIKTLTLMASGYGWIHFDVMALETDRQGQTNVRTSAQSNPPSHDVTWKEEDGGGPPQEIPEPGTLLLLGSGLIGLGAFGVRKKRSRS